MSILNNGEHILYTNIPAAFILKLESPNSLPARQDTFPHDICVQTELTLYHTDRPRIIYTCIIYAISTKFNIFLSLICDIDFLSPCLLSLLIHYNASS